MKQTGTKLRQGSYVIRTGKWGGYITNRKSICVYRPSLCSVYVWDKAEARAGVREGFWVGYMKAKFHTEASKRSRADGAKKG